VNREQYKKWWRFVRIDSSARGIPQWIRDAYYLRQYPQDSDQIWNYRRKAARLHHPDYSFAEHKGGYWLQIGADRHVTHDEHGYPIYSFVYEYQRLDAWRENGKPFYGFGVYEPVATVPFECRVEAMRIIMEDEKSICMGDIWALRSRAWAGWVLERQITDRLLRLSIHEAVRDVAN
jgi:hypothetical protein